MLAEETIIEANQDEFDCIDLTSSIMLFMPWVEIVAIIIKATSDFLKCFKQVIGSDLMTR